MAYEDPHLLLLQLTPPLPAFGSSTVVRVTVGVGGRRTFRLVDASLRAHALEGSVKGIHHGVCQHLGGAFVLTLEDVAVHLEGQVLVDLTVNKCEHFGAHLVIRRAVRDT